MNHLRREKNETFRAYILRLLNDIFLIDAPQQLLNHSPLYNHDEEEEEKNNLFQSLFET